MKKSNNKITGNLILGQNIRAIRISRKLTQEQFAEELEINPHFVSQIENGKVGISINKVIKICNLYNRSCIDVFKGLIEKPNILEEYELLEEKRNGEMAGLYGQGLRIEAIIINADINIQYRVHMEEIGWGDWVPNGCMAGTTGESRRIEAIEIQSSKNVMIGQGYVENIGYQNEVSGTQIIIGTTGQGLRLEGFRLKFL